jgi:hypothetical protein
MKSSDRVKLALLTLGASMAVAMPAFAQDTAAADDAAAAAIVGSSLLVSGCMFIVGLVFFVFWVWMLVDMIRRPETAFPTGSKILWILLALFVSVSVVFYFFMVFRKQKI